MHELGKETWQRLKPRVLRIVFKMSTSWNSKINGCFRDFQSSNDTGNTTAGSVVDIDFAFHTLDKLPEELQTEKKYRKPAYRPHRRKSAKEIADLKRIDEIIAKSSTFMPPKLKMPISYFEGTGVNPYKTENSKEGKATTEMAKESGTKDENLDEVFYSKCVISKTKHSPETHLKGKAISQGSSFIPETFSKVQVSRTSEEHKIKSEAIPAPHYKKNNSSNAWHSKQHQITSSFTKNITSPKSSQSVSSTHYSRGLSHKHQSHSRSSPASVNVSSYCSNRALNSTFNAKKSAVKF